MIVPANPKYASDNNGRSYNIMTLKLAIADLNMEYLERLTSALEEYPDLRISVYSDPDMLAGAIANHSIQVLLLDPSMCDRRYSLDAVPLTIMLASEAEIPFSYRDLPAIRKFQRASQIYQKVLEFGSETFRDNTLAAGSAAILAFYSPVGGAGKTTAALVAAARLALENHPVLYLNLEPYSSDGFYLAQDPAVNGMSDILSRINDENGCKMFLQSCLQTKNENIRYIRHFDNPNDFAAMEPDELEKLLMICRTAAGVDAVIVDMEGVFDEKAKTVFKCADKIVIVEKPDSISSEKLNAFYAQSFIIDEYSDRMVRVLNFDVNRVPALNTELPLVGRMSMFPNADCASLIDAKANSADAAFVSGLLA